MTTWFGSRWFAFSSWRFHLWFLQSPIIYCQYWFVSWTAYLLLAIYKMIISLFCCFLLNLPFSLMPILYNKWSVYNPRPGLLVHCTLFLVTALRNFFLLLVKTFLMQTEGQYYSSKISGIRSNRMTGSWFNFFSSFGF